MRTTQTLVRMAMLTGLGVALSATSIPVMSARILPVQHALNVIAGSLLGPWLGGLVALMIAVIRILLGTGTPLAIPGSVCGAVLAGLLYQRFRTAVAALVGEVIGTGIVGAMLAYPVAVLFMGNARAAAGGVTFFMLPFVMSSGAGAVVGAAVLSLLRRFSPASSQPR